MNKIFLSYRRQDSSGYAGRICDRALQYFGPGSIFFDIETLEGGDDFVDSIEAALASCRAFILVIGPRWLNAVDENGRRRLDDPEDYVVLEIVTALKAGVRVIPALVDGARMPKVEELPPTIAAITRRQAIDVASLRFEYDVSRLFKAVSLAIGQANGSPDTLHPTSPSQPVGAVANEPSSHVANFSGASPSGVASTTLSPSGSVPQGADDSASARAAVWKANTIAPADPASRPTTLRGAVGELDGISSRRLGEAGPKRKSWLTVAVGAGGVAGAVLLFVAISSRTTPPPTAPTLTHSDPSGPPTAAVRLTPLPRSADPAPAADPAEIQFHLKSDPPEAKVTDARTGEVLGFTPLQRTLPRGTSSRSLIVAKDGYVSAKMEVPITAEFTGELTLKPNAAAKSRLKVTSAVTLRPPTPGAPGTSNSEPPSQASVAKPLDPDTKM